MNILRSISGHLYEPFIVWAIFFSIITNITFIPAITDLVKSILESEIYLVIFTTSFVFLYFRQSYPIYKKIKDIKKAQHQDKWVVPLIMSNKVVLDVSLWLGGVLFFTDLMMSLGALDQNVIVNMITYSQLKWELPILGFVCIPAVSGYYSARLDSYFNKLEIKLDKIDSGNMISLLSMTFFITLSYVAIKNILPN